MIVMHMAHILYHRDATGDLVCVVFGCETGFQRTSSKLVLDLCDVCLYTLKKGKHSA